MLTMSKQATCHKWTDKKYWITPEYPNGGLVDGHCSECHKHLSGDGAEAQCHRWVLATDDDEDGHWEPIIETNEFCSRCGTRLNADGSETRMVAAVAGEAVRATRLYRLLSRLHEGPLLDDEETHAEYGDILALAEWGLVSVRDDSADAPWCPGLQGEVLLAALQQAAAQEGTDGN